MATDVHSAGGHEIVNSLELVKSVCEGNCDLEGSESSGSWKDLGRLKTGTVLKQMLYCMAAKFNRLLIFQRVSDELPAGIVKIVRILGSLSMDLIVTFYPNL